MFLKSATANCVTMTDPDVPRCGARLRQGGSCRLPPAPGRHRCFQHGGARGIGAPNGNRNARKHGVYAAAEIAERRRINAFYRQCVQTLRDLEEAWKEGR